MMPMNSSNELIIHLDWEGPFTQSQIQELSGPSDYGVYQVYGTHPVYGSNVLLYIGLAESQTFAQRLPQHGWCNMTSDAKQVSFYIGRLFGNTHPDNKTWGYHIKLAERLLIHAHKPAQNTQKELAGLENDLWFVHVVNWRYYRDLMPEVSGARWTGRFDDLSYDTRYTIETYRVQKLENVPNKAVEPTPVAASPDADASCTLSTSATHL